MLWKFLLDVGASRDDAYVSRGAGGSYGRHGFFGDWTGVWWAPVMLVGLRRVDSGTDGAVTLLGSGAGVVAGILVAAVGAWALRLGILEAAIAAAAGICGLFFDSLLGATVERRGWLGNDLVNFTSTVFAAVLAAAVYRLSSCTRRRACLRASGAAS